MKLPKGVTHLPNQATLIAKDRDAVLRISTRVAGNAAYEVNDRVFATAIEPYLQGDWRTFHLRYPLAPGPVVYSGAEHKGNPKKPNLTVVPNLAVATKPDAHDLDPPRFVLGCTMGHEHPESSGRRVQEVYEFQSYGVMVLATRAGPPEIWVARDGDKVAVPSGFYMTIYNLGGEYNPLITLDYADPVRNSSNKDDAKQFGPILLAWYNRGAVVFTLNETYAGWPVNPVWVSPGRTLPRLEDRTVTIPRAGRLDLGAFLYERLTQDPDTIADFSRLGFRIRRAMPECDLEPIPTPPPPSGPRGPKISVSRPLVDVTAPGGEAFAYFFPGATASPPAADSAAFVREEGQLFAERQRHVVPTKRLGNPMILVEGAGEWVEAAYRPVFQKLVAQGRPLTVFYADDTRWRAAPAWTQKLESWEAYLDKADQRQLVLYGNLRPDAVVVVTPDFTHSDVAQHWVAGGIPLILVEKPFDSLLSNVERLFDALARKQALVAVRGVDHYQFRASPFHDRISRVAAHLGGSPSAIRFFMTETRALESTRLRTLQFGLTLDMLPHLLALLAAFGDIFTIDDVEVIEAGQYTGMNEQQRKDLLEFPNETYSVVRLTFEPFGSGGVRIPVTAVVGKGFKEEVKYLEAEGANGNRIRLDFRKTRPQGAAYPIGYMLFLAPDPGPVVTSVADLYTGAQIHVQEKSALADPKLFYEKLILDIADGRSECLGNTLLPGECWQVVKVLDCIWRAVQDYRSRRGNWEKWPIGSRDPHSMV